MYLWPTRDWSLQDVNHLLDPAVLESALSDHKHCWGFLEGFQMLNAPAKLKKHAPVHCSQAGQSSSVSIGAMLVNIEDAVVRPALSTSTPAGPGQSGPQSPVDCEYTTEWLVSGTENLGSSESEFGDNVSQSSLLPPQAALHLPSKLAKGTSIRVPGEGWRFAANALQAFQRISQRPAASKVGLLFTITA